MNILSDLFNLINLSVDIYHNAQVCGNWQFNAHRIGSTCFHLVTLGSCVLDIPQYPSQILEMGDIVIFPYEIEHKMTPLGDALGDVFRVDYQHIGDATSVGMLCGEIRFKHQAGSTLLNALPPFIIIPYQIGKDWISPLHQLIMYESQADMIGQEVTLARLSELLFIQGLRFFINCHPQHQSILALYSHPKLHKAIATIHQNPQQTHTIDSLAKVTGLSRTLFAQTFKRISGWTVAHYLTWWRMQLAWTYLQQGYTVSQTADKVGYLSESAFSRNFKQHFGVSAGQVRKTI